MQCHQRLHLQGQFLGADHRVLAIEPNFLEIARMLYYGFHKSGITKFYLGTLFFCLRFDKILLDLF